MRVPRFALGLAALALGPALRAHDPGLGTNQVVVHARAVDLDVGYAPADIARLAPGKPLRAVALRLWTVSEAGAVLRPEVVSALVETAGSSLRFHLRYAVRGVGPYTFADAALAALPPGHRDYLVVADEQGATLAEKLLNASAGPVTVDAPRAAEAPAPPFAFLAFLRLGLFHIWTGYDHLLFLFGLLVVCRRFRSVVGIISCFTAAHSLTLALSTLNLVVVPSRIIEPLIAASILYVGVENLVRRGREPRGRWALTFAFGLIHGCGFASALRELGVGSNGRGILLPLVTFNLGVELGQIAVAAAVLPLLWKLRQRPAFAPRWSPLASGAVALAGLVWLLQRSVFA